MIDTVFDHCRGIGPKRVEQLNREGFVTWRDCIDRPNDLPLQGGLKDEFLDTIRESADALARQDIAWFTGNFHSRHHGKLLETFFDRAVFFDIETTGLNSYQDKVTVVAALEGDVLRLFVEGENLHDFIDYADTRELLVSFNGACFDLPFLERAFHIPGFAAPHVDLRWIAWHAGFRGGLKALEKSMGINRPPDLESVDGIEALNLYYAWRAGNLGARETLIRYCAADTIASRLVSRKIALLADSRSLPGIEAGFALLDGLEPFV